MPPRRLLALAAGSGRVGAVCLVGGELKDWRMSVKAAGTPELAAAQTQAWIDHLTPDVVVTEEFRAAGRKGEKTLAIIAAMAEVADRAQVIWVRVAHDHPYRNKYEEAEELARRYPEIRAWLPPTRKFYDNEPRNTVLFEALSLADKVMRGGPEMLARAMG